MSRIPKLVMAALLVVFALCVAPGSASGATGDTHLTVATNAGAVLESTRTASGAWSGFTQVPNLPGPARSVDEVVIGGQRNLVVLTSTGLYHSVGTANGWGPFTNVVALGAGQPDIDYTIGSGGLGGRVSAANAGGVLHIVLTGIGQATHTVRNPNGSWSPFNQGALSQRRGSIRNADAVGLADGRLQVAITTLTNPGTVFSTIRSAAGAWSDLAAVPSPPGVTFGIAFVASAAIGDQVHVVLALADARRVYHAIRFADGSWSTLTDVTAQTGVVNGGPIAAIGDANGQVQIAVTGIAAGGLVHSVRQANGVWTPAADVKAAAGDPGPVQGSGLSAD